MEIKTILKSYDDYEKHINLALYKADSAFNVSITFKISGHYYPEIFEYTECSDATKKFNALMLELLDSAEKLHEEDDILIANLDLSIRARNCLLRANIETLSELSERTIIDLMKIRNLGKKCLNEIIEVAREHGVELHAKHKR